MQSSRPRHGVFIGIPSAEIAEMAGQAGWDFVVLDCEHGPIDGVSLAHMIRAAELAGVEPIVRVAGNNSHRIQAALDAGAKAVQVPMISSVDDARAAVAAGRFHPEGARGFNPFVRAARYSLDAARFTETANAATRVILQIENTAGLAAVDGILAIPGVGELFIGPYDLSQSLGIPGQVTHERVLTAGLAIVEKAHARGVPVSVFAATPAAAQAWEKIGADAISAASDALLLAAALRDRLKEIRDT